ncbi:hypothetical protein Fmac_004628 [Flemingia macrophylla]|uniref:NB-ARC domain-containing protein n=1 Tax=Flemingia macrophylla TaxID=520843 RepID=A0ABD1N5P7_9FABA
MYSFRVHKKNNKSKEYSEIKKKWMLLLQRTERWVRMQQVPYEDGSPPSGFSQQVAQIVLQEWGIILQDGETQQEFSSSFTPNQVDNTPYFIKNYVLNEMTIIITQSDIFMIGLHETNYRKRRNIVEKIIRRVEKEGQFDVIVTANIVKKNKWWNKSLDVRRIQEELGIKLGLQLQGKKLEERANSLSDRIKMKQSILIIMKNLTDEINLIKIGIPFHNNNKGCKIILISENLEVLNKMKAQRVFSIDD